MDKPTLADATYKTHAQARHDAEGPAAPVKLWGRISKKPWVAHLLRMFTRFGDRLGSSFAAAITYFTLVSLVPILGLAFSVTGIVLSGRPDLIQELKEQVTTVFEQSGPELAKTVNGIIDNAISARWAVGAISLALGLYTGIGWMTNIRTAVQAQWRPKWDMPPKYQDSFVKGLGKDLVALVVLGVGILVSVVLSAIGTALTGVFAELLGLDDVGWVTAVLSIVPILLALMVSIGLFYFLYRFLPVHSEEVPRRKIWRGAIAAAIIFELFKLLLSTLLQLFSGSATAAAFGSIIVLLAIVNLVARMVLMIAAWIGTSEWPAIPEEDDDLAVVVQPQYRTRSVPALAGGIGVGAAAGWVARTVRRRRSD
ncbi:YihY/virulence factor BrkB family protein [Nakamurella deserti]|uniref:YihY/virulence factor BrkB family protein n=1 Tax=Nakamurella deserti TaxID=2164074 RepID=UPI000DBE2910|nr:YhjD/YihY/BrkB family envelope integrity protein [Nakamurella deserti]